jgi:hypothetical protein
MAVRKPKKPRYNVLDEPTWKKVVAVIKAAAAWGLDECGETVAALRKHLKKSLGK